MVCGLGLACLMAMTVFRTRPGQDPSLNWGAAGAFILCAISGSVVGALAGFVGAIRWLRSHGNEPWSLPIWVGITLGLAVALLIRVTGMLDRHISGDVIRWWPGMACFVVALATLGGLAAGVLGQLAKKQFRPE
jgi:hypothetical protein